MQDDRLRVAILFGGRSAEHEVSVVSARGVMEALDSRRFQAVPLGITKEGAWLTPRETQQALACIPPGQYAPLPVLDRTGILARPGILEVLQEVDVVFPLVHGTNGEDGTLQGFLELAHVPYVGAGVAASALGMDKALQKALFRQVGLPVADWLTIYSHEWCNDPATVTRFIEGEMGYPCFVKPANAGSSIGISKVWSRENLMGAVFEALRYDCKVVVEQAIVGREIECSVLGNDEPQASPLGEIIPSREFYDYEAKYHDVSTRLVIPVILPPNKEEEIRRLAVAAFRAIDCSGMGRVDFFLSEEGKVYVNEINTIPGFTPISMYPKLWEVAGLSYAQLISRLIELALERHQKRVARGR